MLSEARDWQPIETAPLNTPVETMILDGSDQRNETTLVQKRRDPSCRSLWFVPDGSMYVYYTPTHWRALEGE